MATRRGSSVFARVSISAAALAFACCGGEPEGSTAGGGGAAGTGTGAAGTGTGTGTGAAGTGGPSTGSTSDGVGASTSSSTSTGGAGALPYPTRGLYGIKGLQPDFWPDVAEIAGNRVGGVSMNLVWAFWEGAPKAAPCDPAAEAEFDGRCFIVRQEMDDAIAAYTSAGVAVTGIVYGVPPYARVANCSPVAAGFDIFCAPAAAATADYGRFVGMVAQRYDGLHGHGRVADFVVHNEVNSNDWYDVGCGQGAPCDVDAWVGSYAASWNAAYDAAIAAQPHAKVFASFTHYFGSELDAPAAEAPLLGVATFLPKLASQVGDRRLRVAYHPYPADLLSPAFSPDDWPRVTYGNLGAIAGFLRKTWPDRPWMHEVHLTESGINSVAPKSSHDAQAAALCDTFRNVLGTPGIESYIYHRMKDHSTELAGGLGLGLRDENGGVKPAWSVFALANRDDLSPPQLSCGFEELPYTRLRRSAHPQRGHWSSSRVAPAGFTTEASWRLAREPEAGAHALYECRVGQHNLVTKDVGCEGQLPLGPVGFAWDGPAAGRVEIFRCSVGAGADHFVSTSASCEGQTPEGSLGYALP